MPPMDPSASTYYDGSWLMGNNCPDLYDVKTEVGGGGGGGVFVRNHPLIGSGVVSSSGESCMLKVEQVVCQRAVHGLSAGPHLASFDCGDPIVSDSLMQGGLDHLTASECASSTGTSTVQRADSSGDELSSIFSTVTSAQLADPRLNELASALPMGDARSDPTRTSLRKDHSCSASGVGVIPVITQRDDHQQQMSGLTGVGVIPGTTHRDNQQQQMSGLTGVGGPVRNIGSLNDALNTVVADQSLSAVKQRTMADHVAHAMLFRPPFTSFDKVLKEEEQNRPKRRNVKISKDPQSVAARHRRERISDRIRVLQRLVPGGTKMDTASMLDEAIQYVKYLQAQVQTLETVGNANSAFDSRLAFGATSMYCNGMAGLPYGPMGLDCMTVSQGMGLGHSDFKDGTLNAFPTLADGNFPVQFCH